MAMRSSKPASPQPKRRKRPTKAKLLTEARLSPSPRIKPAATSPNSHLFSFVLTCTILLATFKLAPILSIAALFLSVSVMGVRNQYEKKPKVKPTLDRDIEKYQTTFVDEGLSPVHGSAAPGVGLKKLLNTGEKMPPFYRLKAFMFLAYWDDLLEVAEDGELPYDNDLQCRYHWLLRAETEARFCQSYYQKDASSSGILSWLMEEITDDLAELRQEAKDEDIVLAASQFGGFWMRPGVNEDMADDVDALAWEPFTTQIAVDTDNGAMPGAWDDRNREHDGGDTSNNSFQEKWVNANSIKAELDLVFG